MGESGNMKIVHVLFPISQTIAKRKVVGLANPHEPISWLHVMTILNAL